jgi:hypothetical protein
MDVAVDELKSLTGEVHFARIVKHVDGGSASVGRVRIEPRMRLAGLLGALDSGSQFSAQRSTPPDDLSIDIAGVGLLELPVSAAQIKRLRSIARPARYGLGEETLVDSRCVTRGSCPRAGYGSTVGAGTRRSGRF